MVIMGAGGRAVVVSSKGCSRLSSSVPSVRGMQSFEPMSPATSRVGSESVFRSTGPFAGLVICVTGLSKEAREQVMEATQRLGGQYSPHLHTQCTHLVVQSFGGRKFEHTLKHGSRKGLFVVTLGWFVDSVRKNVRLNESLYSVKGVGENGMKLDEFNRLVGFSGAENSCLPVGIREAKHTKTTEESRPTLLGHSIYIDTNISSELRNKVVEAATKEGALFLDRWFVGCRASHVVCEGSSAPRYLGHCNNVVTPLWVLKTTKEKNVQRLVQTSADLARQIGTRLEDLQSGTAEEVETNEKKGQEPARDFRSKTSYEERQRIVNLAKLEVRNRRGRRMQTCQTPIRPINPNSLLDSICWSISEPTSTASIYTDSLSCGDETEHQTPIYFDAQEHGKESEASFTNFTRSLTESEKNELVFKDHFITILFPIDRFAEMGPSSRTFFSEKGFTCLQILDRVFRFYQENMSADEVEAAIHTDSRHADRLRSAYASKETDQCGHVIFRRVDFLGSRKSFEMLKRVSGDNNSNVYELLIRA